MDNIDLTGATRIAYADTKHLNRPRWSELSVYHLAKPTEDGRRWLAVSTGMSSKEGETPIVDRHCTFSLYRALELFDDSTIGKMVKSQAIDWADANHPGEDAPEGNEQAPADPPFEGTTDAAALIWLFGEGERNGRTAARAFDMGESTLRMALRNGTAVRVPLLALAPYIDRARFLADLKGRADG